MTHDELEEYLFLKKLQMVLMDKKKKNILKR